MKKRSTAPELEPAQIERLVVLMEELAEAGQAAAKVLRHGYAEGHPNYFDTNRDHLLKELGDVLAAVRLLEANGDLDLLTIIGASDEKLERLPEYLHHEHVFPKR